MVFQRAFGQSALFIGVVVGIIAFSSAVFIGVQNAELDDWLRAKVTRLVATRNEQDRQTPKPFVNRLMDLQLELPVGSTIEGKKAGDRGELAPGIVFRWCPPGPFTMGSPMTEDGRRGNEDQVDVTLTIGFWLGETEVTTGQWQTLMGTTPWSGKRSVKEGGDYAASYISHHDAVWYCKKLTSQELNAGRLPKGWKFALPTEAQWEYGCRAGMTTKFSFGDAEPQLGEYAWFDENADRNDEKYAHRVGQKKSNPWGLKDMHGNVWEWCSDWYHSKLPGGRDPDPRGPGILDIRVDRGGCWGFSASYCRSAQRDAVSPEFRSSAIGFRLAAVPD